jgi:RNA polymerase sigma-70 factor, ECF subfamily
MSADRAVERTVREAYGRLVAILAARRRDIMSAEDALQEAIVAALTQWPVTGIPQRPEAWLISVAQRRLLDGDRRAVLLREAQAYLQERSSGASGVGTRAQQLPDDRLELMLLCAHPAIDASTRAPLILQTVLGLDAGTIASAFLVPPHHHGPKVGACKTEDPR